MRRRRTSTPSTTLPQDQWGACGITEVTTTDGRRIPSHPRGDQFAADVIAGRVSPARARAQHVATQQMLASWRRTAPTPAEALLAQIVGR